MSSSTAASGHGDDALALEHPGHRAGRSERAAVLAEGEAHVGGRAIAVVGQRLDDQRRAARAVALVGDRVVGLAVGVGAGAARDRALDVVLRHRDGPRALDRVGEVDVGVGIGPALLGGHDDGARELREELAALGVGGALLVLDRRPLGVTGHLVSFDLRGGSRAGHSRCLFGPDHRALSTLRTAPAAGILRGRRLGWRRGLGRRRRGRRWGRLVRGGLRLRGRRDRRHDLDRNLPLRLGRRHRRARSGRRGAARRAATRARRTSRGPAGTGFAGGVSAGAMRRAPARAWCRAGGGRCDPRCDHGGDAGCQRGAGRPAHSAGPAAAARPGWAPAPACRCGDPRGRPRS